MPDEKELEVGFVGLGLIGLPMARLMAESFHAVAYDSVKIERDIGKLRLAESLAEVARMSEVVCLSLPSPEASESVIRALVAVRSSRIKAIVELSTVGYDTVDRCAEMVAQAGIHYVDAPVSGGVARATTGELSIMVAGDDSAIAFVRPVLERISTKIFVMGDRPGLGQVMKVANNIIGATSLAVTSEAVVFGTRLGLSAEKMIEVINASTGRTESSEVKFPRSILSGTFKQGARSAIMHKDVYLYKLDAEATGMPLLIAGATYGIWDQFWSEHPEDDFSLIYKYIEDRAGPLKG